MEECKLKEKNEILCSPGEYERENRRVCREDLMNPLRSGDIKFKIILPLGFIESWNHL